MLKILKTYYIQIPAILICFAFCQESKAQVRAYGLSNLKTGYNFVTIPLKLPGDDTQYYLGSSFTPTTSPALLNIYKNNSGELYIMYGQSTMSYLIYGNEFRNKEIPTTFYKRGRYDNQTYTTPQLQYLIGKDFTGTYTVKDRAVSDDHGPYIAGQTGEYSLQWATTTAADWEETTKATGPELYDNTYTPATPREPSVSGDGSTGSTIAANTEKTTWTCVVASAQSGVAGQNVFQINPDFESLTAFATTEHYTFQCTITAGEKAIKGIFKVAETGNLSNDFVFSTDSIHNVAVDLAAGESKTYTIPYGSIKTEAANISLAYDIQTCDAGATFTVSNVGIKRSYIVEGKAKLSAYRYCRIDVDNDGYLNFILKDNNLQNNSDPINATDETLVDDSPFKNLGTSFSSPLYLMCDTKGTNNAKYLRVITSADKETSGVKLSSDITILEGDNVKFQHNSGVVYTSMGTPPADLTYDTDDPTYKTDADDPRINAGVELQRTHEYTHEIYVMPGQTYNLTPFSDFSSSANYKEVYNRWFDYRTDTKSSRLSFSSNQTLYTLDNGYLGGSWLTNNRYNGTIATYTADASPTADANGVIDIMAIDVANICTYSNNVKMNSAGDGVIITEPTLQFRHLFVIKDAKDRADEMTASKSANDTYIEAHKIKLMCPGGVPFQYRLDCYEPTQSGKYTDYWYKKTDGTYAQVPRYRIETYEDGTLKGSTTYTAASNTKSFKTNLFYTYKALSNQNRFLYIRQPEAGHTYTIKVFAYDGSNDICIAGTTTPIELMEYDLEVLTPENGNMITEDELTASENDATYAHQRPANMKELYGTPTTEVDFDEISTSDCTASGSFYYYKWPWKWENSSYAFGYSQRYDFNMYMVADNTSITPYHAAAAKVYDRLYQDTGGKQRGFFYYANAASDPSRMAVLNIGKDFCQGTKVYVSAWMMECSAVNETANVVFSFRGVDDDGNETLLNSFATGYVTGGSNTTTGESDGGDNPANRGKWMHVYYTFTSENYSTLFDHYIITLENNCAGSNGADYIIDDIEAYVCKPSVSAHQLSPVCNGTTSTDLKLSGNFDTLIQSFAATEDSEEKNNKQKFYYCFLDKATYDNNLLASSKAAGYESYAAWAKVDGTDVARLTAYKEAFNAALITKTYGTGANDNYGEMSFDLYYEGNELYDASTYNPSTVTKNVALREQINSTRNLIFPCDATDSKLYVGKEYIVALCLFNPENPVSYDLTSACARTSTFTVIFSGEVKIDGVLDSDMDGVSVCANQKPVITIDMNGVAEGGVQVKTENAYFDWYYGPLNLNTEQIEQGYTVAYYTEKTTYKDASDVEHTLTLDDALYHFRYNYPSATDLSSAPTGEYTQEMKDYLQEMVDADKLVLYKNSESLSTMQQFNDMLDPDVVKTYYITAIPVNQNPADNVKYCLEPLQVSISISTRTPRMKNGDDSGNIPYPTTMRDVPLRIGLAQLKKPVIANLDATTADHILYMPLREITPATTGVTSLIQKAADTFVYLAASTDPHVAAGTSGATDITNSELKVIGKVLDIHAAKGSTGNVCHLAFLKAFEFREGYEYTIKFNFEENYSGIEADHSDVCPGEVICTIKVVPEYQMWTGAKDSNWNNDGNWRRVSTSDLNMSTDEAFVKELWSITSAGEPVRKSGSYTPAYDSSTGAYTLNNMNYAGSQWGLVVQYHTNFITFDKSKTYKFSCKFKSTKKIPKVSWKFDDQNVFHTYDYNGTYTIPEGESTFVVDGIPGVDLTSAVHLLMFAFGFAETGTNLTISDMSLTVYDASKKDFFTDGGSNDNTNSFVPADFTKVVIPANVAHMPKLYNLRTGTASTDKDDASTNLTIVSYAGNPSDCDFIKDMTVNETAVTDTATKDINYDMSSIDLTGTDEGNVACRSWYDHTCEYIHFNSEAQMLSQQYLNYEKAWADFEMEPNKWTTISSPLLGVVAGDFYLPTASGRQDTPLFEDISFNASLHDRFNPAVYQRTWNAKDAKIVHLTGDNTSSAVSLDWSEVYNDVNVDYSAGAGFAIKPDVSMMSTKPSKVKFRLPKADKSYYYWNPAHQDGTVKSESVAADLAADGTRLHRLADFTSTTYQKTVGQSGATGTQYFLVGNPMMCYLNMSNFFAENTNLEEKYWIVTGKGQQYAMLDDKTDGYVGTVADTYVAPFQSFFVALKSGENDTFTPTFTSNMMAVKNVNGSYEMPNNDENNEGETKAAVLDICATDSLGNESRLMLTDGSENQVNGVEALFDSNLQMSGCPMLYTNKNGEAMSLTQIEAGDTLAVALSGARSKVNIKLTGVKNILTPLYLIDAATGETTSLNDDVVLNQTENGVRYYITTGIANEEETITVPQVEVHGNVLTVKAGAGAVLDYVHICRVDGVTMVTKKDAREQFSITLQRNVYLIDVETNGKKYTFKMAIQ